MAPRLKLQEILQEIRGSEAVYFQPPRNLQMEYPCIVYNVDGLNSEWADNLAYKQDIEYQIVVIDRNPDNDAWLKVGQLPKSTFQRKEVVDNLNHYYFNVYF